MFSKGNFKNEIKILHLPSTKQIKLKIFENIWEAII